MCEKKAPLIATSHMGVTKAKNAMGPYGYLSAMNKINKTIPPVAIAQHILASRLPILESQSIESNKCKKVISATVETPVTKA